MKEIRMFQLVNGERYNDLEAAVKRANQLYDKAMDDLSSDVYSRVKFGHTEKGFTSPTQLAAVLDDTAVIMKFKKMIKLRCDKDEIEYYDEDNDDD